MDNEAQILLDDVIAFCQRDGLGPRMVGMLSQCRAVELTDEALYIEAPSRFAIAQIEKNRTVIEAYLEQIVFAPVALVATAPEGAAGTVPPVATSASPAQAPLPQAGMAPAAGEPGTGGLPWEKHPQKPGRPGKNNQEAARLSAARKKAEEIKNSSYALGKAPENLTKNQALKLELIASENKQLYRAYFLKEKLRLLLKIKNVDEAEAELKRWLWRASHSRISAICDLCRKIRRHKEHIMNTIRLSMSNARIEAINNKIKLIIRKAYGFRNITNMLDMVYLVCSNLRIPLPNRKATVAKAA